MTLKEELERYGWTGERADFNDLLIETRQVMHPAWSDDALLCEPDAAKHYCNVIRQRSASPLLPDNLILRCLIGIRKRGEGGPPC